MTEIKNILPDGSLALKFKHLNEFLSQEPDPSWLCDHKTATRNVNGVETPVQYIPVGIIEDQLRNIFGMFLVVVKHWQHIHNSVGITITLKIPSPLSDSDNEIEWLEMDGVGAYPIFDSVYGVQQALPAAESFALKDAAEKFGKLFGSDINRVDPAIGEEAKAILTMEIIEEIDKAIDTSRITEIYHTYPMLHDNPQFTTLLKEKRIALIKK